MGRRKQTEYIKGTAQHRRTEGDYMGVLLDTVTLNDWRSVVNGALQAAKGGGPTGPQLAGAVPGRQAGGQGTHAIEHSGTAIKRA